MKKTRKAKSKVKIYPLADKKKISEHLILAVNELLEVLSPGKNNSVDLARLEELTNHPHLEIYLLEIDGEISGMGSLHYMETLLKKSVWIEDVVVHPKH